MAHNIIQDAVGSDSIYVRSLLNAGWSWNPPAATPIIDWAADPADNWSPAQVQTLITMFGTWAAVANVSFQQVTILGDAEIVLHRTLSGLIDSFGGYSGTPFEATANTPFDDVTIAEHGQVHTYLATDGWLISGQPETFLDDPTTAGDDDGNLSAEGIELLLHEVGHALGLKHPHDSGAISTNNVVFPGVTAGSIGNNGLNQSIYTLMSYNHWIDSGGIPGADIPVMSTPMAFDIAAIQRLYGANTNSEMAITRTSYRSPAQI